jgi:hypothetical protein
VVVADGGNNGLIGRMTEAGLALEAVGAAPARAEVAFSQPLPQPVGALGKLA